MKRQLISKQGPESKRIRVERGNQPEPCEARDLVFQSKIIRKILGYLKLKHLGKLRLTSKAMSVLGLREIQRSHALMLGDAVKDHSPNQIPEVLAFCQGFAWVMASRPCQMGFLGPSCTHLELGCEGLISEGPYAVPDSVTHLMCSYDAMPQQWPSKLESIEYWHNWDTDPFVPAQATHARFCLNERFKVFPDVPEGVKTLELKLSFLAYRKVLLPSSLQKLTLLDSMTVLPGPLDWLNHGLTHLVLDQEFQGSMASLPSTLKKLEFQRHNCFNQPLDNLPQGLEVLKLGHFFDKPLDTLPRSLKVLIIRSKSFNHPLDNLPQGLKVLQIGTKKNKSCFDQPLDKLPQGIEKLILFMGWTLVSWEKPRLSLKTLPMSLLYLTLRLNCPCRRKRCLDAEGFRETREEVLDSLPPGLKYLDLDCYNGPVNKLPRGIQEVRLLGPFDHDLSGLPDSIVSLALGNKFDQFLPAQMPKSLLRLSLGSVFSKPVSFSVGQRFGLLVLNPNYQGHIRSKSVHEVLVHPNYKKDQDSKINKKNFLRRFTLEGGSWKSSLLAKTESRLARAGHCIQWSTCK